VFATLGLDPATGPPPTDPVAAGEGGVVALLTGLSGSGKSTIARAVAVRLVEEGRTVTLLDGDRVRHHLSSGLGFSAADRDTNVRRIGWVAAEIAHHGGTAICSPIAPAERVRREVADFVAHRGGRFVLVHVATPLEECERRDRKGLYAAARRGEIPEFTGISAPYEVPADPDLRLDTTGRSVEECAAEVLDLIDHVRAPDSRA
jgi:sulfate adenylyltransferase